MGKKKKKKKKKKKRKRERERDKQTEQTLGWLIGQEKLTYPAESLNCLYSKT